MGQKGRKNCLETGNSTEARMAVETAALTRGLPGIIQSEKMPQRMSTRYCTSYQDQRCARRERRVSAGEKDVWREAKLEAGDCLLRIFDRNLRRMR